MPRPEARHVATESRASLPQNLTVELVRVPEWSDDLALSRVLDANFVAVAQHPVRLSASPQHVFDQGELRRGARNYLRQMIWQVAWGGDQVAKFVL